MLPKQLCQNCLESLTNSYNFISKCQQSQQTLLQVLNQQPTSIKIEIKEEEEIKREEQEEEREEQMTYTEVKVAEVSFSEKSDETEEDSKEMDIDFVSVESTDGEGFSERYNLADETEPPSKEKLFRCELCSVSFARAKNLAEHKMIHTGERPHVCSFCHKGFIRRSRLAKHLEKNPKNCTCRVCGETFEQPCLTKIHAEATHAQTTSKDKYKLSQRIMMRQQALIPSELIASADLQGEQQTDTSKKRLKCEHCDKMFQKQSELRRHTYIHTGEKPYLCKKCGMRFNQTSHLVRHFKRTHLREKPFKCKYCDKGFAAKQELGSHESIHTGERPYVCLLCDKGFARRESMYKHMKVHSHSTVKEEPKDV